MSNPYTKSHQAGQHQAWLEGLRAGVELAKKHVWVYLDREYDTADLDWSYVDMNAEEQCK